VPGSASAIGRIRIMSQPSYTGSPSSTATAQAFGNATPAGSASPHSALSPMRAHGLRFWLAVGAVGFAFWVYIHLPE
jgi:hypothetical protein